MTSLAPSPNSPSAQTPADELRALKASLTDLQTKRLNALRLYQDEKSRRQQESARAAELSAQLHKLQNAPQNPTPSQTPPPAKPNSSKLINTDFFAAELRALGRAQTTPYASLTWHCLAMADLLVRPPDVLAILHPKAPLLDAPVEDAVSISGSGSQSSRDLPINGRQPHQSESEAARDVAQLMERLQILEAEAEAAKRSVHDNERLIVELKSQLDQSTAACKDLLETVKEQEDTIERLS